MCRFSKKAFCLLATASASTIASVRHERRKRRINYGTTPWVNVNIDSRGLAALSRGTGRLFKEFRKRQKDQERQGKVEHVGNYNRSIEGNEDNAFGFKDNSMLRLNVLKITPDGRCLFRALVQGMSSNRYNTMLTGSDEKEEADRLRRAVNDALCRSGERRKNYVNAVRGLKHEYGSLEKYCRVSQMPSHWGGEVELLVLAKMLQQCIIVYRPLANGGAFKVLAQYGEEHAKKNGTKPVRLLYNLRDHYDLLV